MGLYLTSESFRGKAITSGQLLLDVWVVLKDTNRHWSGGHIRSDCVPGDSRTWWVNTGCLRHRRGYQRIFSWFYLLLAFSHLISRSVSHLYYSLVYCICWCVCLEVFFKKYILHFYSHQTLIWNKILVVRWNCYSGQLIIEASSNWNELENSVLRCFLFEIMDDHEDAILISYIRGHEIHLSSRVQQCHTWKITTLDKNLYSLSVAYLVLA